MVTSAKAKAEFFKYSTEYALHKGVGAKLWMIEEDEIIRKYYPNFKILIIRLPTRTEQAIRSRAKKIGMPRLRLCHHWTTTEVRRLCKLYNTASPDELRAAFPFASLQAIKLRACKEGARRPRIRERGDTGIPIIDEIRRRAYQLNFSMHELDKACKTKYYFCNSCYNIPINTRALFKALKLLGGTLKISWDDLGES